MTTGIESSSASTASATGTGSNRTDSDRASAQLSQTFDDFLLLLTTQLRNQDPISPIDSTEFTNQLVSFSQVEQQIATNEKLDQLLTLQGANGFSEGLDYLGREVEVIGSDFAFDGEPVTVGYGMPSGAQVGIVEIRNAAGGVIHVQEASNRTGRNELVWNGQTVAGGTAPTGPYSITVRATDAEGELLDVPTFVRGRVDGVENVDGTSTLLVGGRPVDLADILAVRAPADEG